MRQRMALSYALVVLAMVMMGAHANDTKGVVIEKSFLQSVQDCVEYLRIPRQRLAQYLAYEFPPDEETKCLIYCVGTDLRWWNNTCGLQFPAIVNFFQPVLGDRQYEKRTKECVERTMRSGRELNSCCQAYETFQCYFKEFGNLVTCPQYVPATKLQATQAALDCLTMLRVPVDLLQCYSRGNVPDVPETRCMYHCIDLRTGLYNSETGVQLPRFYVRDLAVDDLRYLSKETKVCRDRIRQSGCDVCSEVYQTHQECLAGLGENGYTSGLITEAAKLALTNLGVGCADQVEPVREQGYSYASYQRVEVPCQACASQAPVAVHPPPPDHASFQPARKQPCSCEDKPLNSVLQSRLYQTSEVDLFKPDPFAKRQPANHRQQMVYYPAPEVSPSPQTPSPQKPMFSTFSGRANGQRPHGPYPCTYNPKSK
ncbi:AGAP010649-PA-like protein [Anopheles sinensis]|uniref:AGAP010649-PA-like protein n=1 Tax=Anopheles sinensis TaxID=74873 RepID=A0A084W8F4_ANOSI|nr:AGAP010649-PA-like protein [Anopheles sinensis]